MEMTKNQDKDIIDELVDDEGELSLKKILDWDYYKERLGSAILKIVSIPAVL